MTDHNRGSFDDRNMSSSDYEREIENTRNDIDDSLHSLEERLSPRQIWNRTVDDWSDDIKYFSDNLKNTVRDNPVPVILMGVSLVWMMTGSNSRKVYRYAAGEQYRQDGSSKGLGRKYQRVKSTVSEKAEDLGDSLKEKYSDVKGRAEEAFDHAGQKISGAKESAGDTLDDAGRTISRASDRVGDRADDLHRRGREFGRATRRKASDLSGKPFLLAAAGIALGSIAALSMPVTTKEEELMHEKSKKLVKKSKKFGKEKYEEGIEAAEAAAGAAVDTAKQKLKEKEATA